MTPEWVARFFDNQYGQMDLTWSPSHQEMVARGLIDYLELEKENSVFDQCCGLGGLGWGLAREGIFSLGVDQSQAYIEHAQKHHPKTPTRADFICEDAFYFKPEIPMDACVNWHSSFGYAGVEGAKKLIANMRHPLKNNKRWLLELPNLAYLKNNFKSELKQELTGEREGQVLIRESKWKKGWLHQDWTITQNGRILWQQKDTQCWHFSHSELFSLIQEVGDIPIGIYSDFNKTPLTDDHPRMIWLMEKRDE